MARKHSKFIFVTGGVVSGLGKGVAAATVGLGGERRGEGIWGGGRERGTDGRGADSEGRELPCLHLGALRNSAERSAVLRCAHIAAAMLICSGIYQHGPANETYVRPPRR